MTCLVLDQSKSTMMFVPQSLADQGKLSTLTVDNLKIYCAAHGLAKSGKKADVIDRITRHLGGQ